MPAGAVNLPRRGERLVLLYPTFAVVLALVGVSVQPSGMSAVIRTPVRASRPRLRRVVVTAVGVPAGQRDVGAAVAGGGGDVELGRRRQFLHVLQRVDAVHHRPVRRHVRADGARRLGRRLGPQVLLACTDVLRPARPADAVVPMSCRSPSELNTSPRVTVGQRLG